MGDTFQLLQNKVPIRKDCYIGIRRIKGRHLLRVENQLPGLRPVLYYIKSSILRNSSQPGRSIQRERQMIPRPSRRARRTTTHQLFCCLMKIIHAARLAKDIPHHRPPAPGTQQPHHFRQSFLLLQPVKGSGADTKIKTTLF